MSTQPTHSPFMATPSAPTDLLATYGPRVGAYLLDLVFANVLVIIGAAADVSALVVIGFVGSLVYPFATMLRSGPTNGQTFGKQIVGIRVVPQTAVPMRFGKVCLRELIGRLLFGYFTFGLYTIVDYLWPLWDDKNQALHDKIASTVVVRADADPSLIAAIGMPIVFAAPTSPAPAAPPPPPPPPPPPSPPAAA
jgi:uncharacterized RDD family membrane protein YckC